MYDQQIFTKVKDISPGAIKLTTSGADIILRYKQGEVLVNAAGSIGQVMLTLHKIETEKNDRPPIANPTIADQIQTELLGLHTSSIKRFAVNQLLRNRVVYLFTGKTADNSEIITLPFPGDDDDTEEIDDRTIAVYSIKKSRPVEEIFDLFDACRNGRELVRDREASIVRADTLIERMSRLADEFINYQV
ncbi:MAG: hypothetical protein Q7R96_04490 [Nanoarchaeota archaeon]|nr:hypothetical protein [Nanoarchaeota archaeon]